MASPRKRLKIAGTGDSIAAKFSKHSTPEHSSEENSLYAASISSIGQTPEGEENGSDVGILRTSAKETSLSTETTASEMSQSTEKSSKKNVPMRKAGTDETSQYDESESSSSSSVASETATETNSLAAGYEYTGEDYDAYFENCARIDYKGHLWKLYKPNKEEESLYGKILLEPDNVASTIAELIHIYHRHPEDAIESLILLCVNLAGFKNFDGSWQYNVSQYQECSKRIVTLLESNKLIKENNLVKTGKYLFSERNVTLAKALRMGVYNFIQKFIILAHMENILYDVTFTNCFFGFVKCMVTRTLKCVRHTGLIIAVKVLTALILVKNSVIKDPHFLKNNPNNPTAARLVEKNDTLDIFIEEFYFIFQKNCQLRDEKLSQMREECIMEAVIWNKYFPKLFITRFETIECIKKLIVDEAKSVRLAALVAVDSLVHIPQVLSFLKNKKDLVNAIERRFLDVDVDVSVKAIEIFQSFLRINFNLITVETFQSIGNLIFSQYAPIGEAASTFFTDYFNSQGKSPANVILSVVALYCNRKIGDCKKEHLVEGFLYVCEQMRDWKSYCNILSSKIVDPDKRLAVAEIFSESIYQYINGKPDKIRKMSKANVDLDPSIHESIAELFPTLQKLLYEESNPQILNQVMRIVRLVDTTCLENNYCKRYEDIGDTIRVIFGNFSEEDLLKRAVEVLVYVQDFSIRGKNIATMGCNDAISDLVEFLNNAVHAETIPVTRVAILYQHFNLNEEIDFHQLSSAIEEISDEADLKLLACCMWSIIWKLRSSVEDPAGQYPEIESKCDIVCGHGFNMLQKTEKGEKYLIEVFSLLCDFYQLFYKEQKAKLKLNREFELKIRDKALQKCLIDFLEKYVISSTTSNNNLSLFERRTFVVKYVELALIDVIPILSLSNIFKYYFTYQQEYGPIIDQCLTILAEGCIDQTMQKLIVYTMTQVYENIFAKFSLVDVRTEEATQLKTLAKQFATFKYFHKCGNDDIKIVINCTVIYAIKKEENLTFLMFVKPFLDLIGDKDYRKRIRKDFKHLIPQEFRKNDSVLYFTNTLEGETTKKGAVKKTETKDKENKSSKKGGPSKKGKEKKPKPRKESRPSIDITSSSEENISIHGSDTDNNDASESSISVIQARSMNETPITTNKENRRPKKKLRSKINRGKKPAFVPLDVAASTPLASSTRMRSQLDPILESDAASEDDENIRELISSINNFKHSSNSDNK